MSNNAKSILGFSKVLFWDIEPQKIDSKKQAAFIIERVLSLGTMEDFNVLKSIYGKTKIKNEAKKIRYLDDRVLHFCSIYFKTPLNEFRCYIAKQSNHTHWNY
jgi:hypothetical protein